MPVFLERFVLPVLAATLITVIIVNPLKMDWQQRTALIVAVVAVAYFVGHTLQRGKGPTSPQTAITATAPTPLSKPSGDATTSGNASPAVTGNENTIKYQNEAPPKKKPANGSNP